VQKTKVKSQSEDKCENYSNKGKSYRS